MSKNFVDYGNATALMGGVADRIDKDKFIGTKAEWDRLTEEEKAAYNGRVVNITDDSLLSSDVVNAVEEGNMSAVTSNAVYVYVDSMITSALNAGY